MAGTLTPGLDGTLATTGATGGTQIECDARLVEAAVFFALRGTPLEPVYQSSREVCYDELDPEARDLAFSRLHHAWFAQLDLAQPVFEALKEQPTVLVRTARRILAPGIRRKDEYAELFGNATRATDGEEMKPHLVIRLRPESFGNPEYVLQHLRHELMHIADMLHPEFAYDPSPAQFQDEKGVTAAIRERYRVLWDTYIDGRLSSAGRSSPDVRAQRLIEFTRTFQMLGAGIEAAFGAVFDADELRHPVLLQFALNPGSIS